MTTSEDPLTPFEARLAALHPRARLDRDRLMFLAGQASAVYWPEHRRVAFGPLVLTAAVAISATTLLLTVTESASRIVERVVEASTRVPEPSRLADGHASREQVEYRVEMGNSLGMFFSFLVGRKPMEIDPERSSQSLSRLRDSLLKEGMPEEPDPRAANDEALPNN